MSCCVFTLAAFVPSAPWPRPRHMTRSTATVLVLDTDTTVLSPLVKETFAIDPAATVSAIRRHPLDKTVELSFEDTVALGLASRRLEEKIKAVVGEHRTSSPHSLCVWLPDMHLANMFRRALLTRIPVFAIVSVGIRENGREVLDEIVAHRLGALAIVSDALDVGRLEVGEGGAVRARDIVFAGSARVASSDLDVLIVQAGRGGFSAEVTLGRGTAAEHARFAATAAVAYAPEVAAPPDLPDGKLPDGVGLDADRKVLTGPGPGRREWLQEVLGVSLEYTGRVKLTVQSLGQHTAEECLRIAKDSLLDELRRTAALFLAKS